MTFYRNFFLWSTLKNLHNDVLKIALKIQNLKAKKFPFVQIKASFYTSGFCSRCSIYFFSLLKSKSTLNLSLNLDLKKNTVKYAALKTVLLSCISLRSRKKKLFTLQWRRLHNFLSATVRWGKSDFLHCRNRLIH